MGAGLVERLMTYGAAIFIATSVGGAVQDFLVERFAAITAALDMVAHP